MFRYRPGRIMSKTYVREPLSATTGQIRLLVLEPNTDINEHPCGYLKEASRDRISSITSDRQMITRLQTWPCPSKAKARDIIRALAEWRTSQSMDAKD